MNFYTMTASFSVTRITSKMVADEVCEICIREDALIHLGAAQLVQIAKSMNSELKVNTKQSKESLVETIMTEAVNFPIEEIVEEEKVDVELKPRTVSTKEFCYAEFAKIDINNKEETRELVKALVEQGLNLRVVQSYVSNFRKANK